MVWESSDVVRFDLESLLQGQTRIAKLKMIMSCFLLALEVCNVNPTGNLLMWTDLTLVPSFKVK